GTLSPLLKRLTAAGLVTRHRRVEDERSVSIALTDKGRALRERALPINESMIGTIGFDSDEFRDLMKRLRLLTDRVTNGEAFCA
ncbi:MAG: MarR family winged helix-turn-helix transcriptional regulator, partial [Actinomycetota bacterium]|nr:MarR family winged helix-turn-helix transcriptional regulator [Actinomycetota bacterium]